MLLLGEGQEKTREVVDEAGNRVEKVVRKGIDPAAAEEEMKRLIGCRDVVLSQSFTASRNSACRLAF